MALRVRWKILTETRPFGAQAPPAGYRRPSRVALVGPPMGHRSAPGLVGLASLPAPLAGESRPVPVDGANVNERIVVTSKI